MFKGPPLTLKTCIIIRFVVFEDLGTFESVLIRAGYRIHYYDVGFHELWTIDPVPFDLLIVLGGSIGVHDQDRYPVLQEVREIVAARLAVDRPVLGICLGAQLIAQILGATVSPMGCKEIGFSSLHLTAAGRQSPLRHLEGVKVLHWHGDQFDLPEGVVALASTPLCAVQAFERGKSVLALQFHPELAPRPGLEPWLLGHAVEIATAGFDPNLLRQQAETHGADLAVAGALLVQDWLARLAAPEGVKATLGANLLGG